MAGSQEVKAADGPHAGTMAASFTTPVASTHSTRLNASSAYPAHRLVLNHEMMMFRFCKSQK